MQEEHHNVIKENNKLIDSLTKELNTAQKNKLSNFSNYDDIVKLNSQLTECSKQNEQLNSTLQRLTVSKNTF